MSIIVSAEDIEKFNALLQKEKEFKENSRKRANKYYHKHFKLNDNMGEEEKEIVKKNIADRQKKLSEKYRNNREFFISRQKQYRKNKLERLKREAEEENTA